MLPLDYGCRRARKFLADLEITWAAIDDDLYSALEDTVVSAAAGVRLLGRLGRPEYSCGIRARRGPEQTAAAWRCWPRSRAPRPYVLTFAALNLSQAAWKSAPARAWRPKPRSSGFGHFGTNSAFWRSSPRWTEPVAFRQFIWTGRRLSIPAAFRIFARSYRRSPLSNASTDSIATASTVAIGAACRRWRSRSGRRSRNWSLIEQEGVLLKSRATAARPGKANQDQTNTDCLDRR